MEFRTLQYFLAVAREENISRAAEMLHITQPALSRQMAQLEAETGQQLFKRGRHLELTDAGILLRRRAQEIVDLMDRMELEMEEQGEISGEISIGFGGLSAASAFMKYLKQFHVLHPAVHFRLYANNADYVMERLDHGLLDFGILMEPDNIDKYEYLRLPQKEVFGLAMPKDDPLAEKAVITREDLLKREVIMPERSSVQTELNAWLGEKVDQLKIFGTVNLTISSTADLVSEEKIPMLAVQGALSADADSRVVFRPLSPAVEMNSVLAWKKMAPSVPAVHAFLDYVRSMHSMHSSNKI